MNFNSLGKTICAMVAGAGVVLGMTQFHYDRLPQPTQPTQQTQQTSSEVHMYGVLRAGPGGWVLLNNATHIPQGLGAVECESDGELRIEFQTPLQTVGTASASPDETYAGKVFMGPSVGLTAIYITFRINGSVVHCSSPLLVFPNGNFQLDVWGNVA